MIVLFTDFGADDIYVGHVKAVLLQNAPGVAVIDLLHNAPTFSPLPSAHLLAALCEGFPEGSIFLTIVDPGVGGPRQAVVVEADSRYYVGPDNGLLSVLAARAKVCRFWRITWRPEKLAATFHGRDLFAPIAAAIASKGSPVAWPANRVEAMATLQVVHGPDDLAEIIYIDHYGNALTGLRAENLPSDCCIAVNDAILPPARTFGDLPPGTAFWYANSLGLVEIAVNQASAALSLGLLPGDPVRMVPAANR